jgi:hypothetical protein
VTSESETRAFDPQRSVMIVALVFFVKAAGFIVVAVLAVGDTLSLGARIVPPLLAAGTIAAGGGLLRWKRWAWLLSMCVLLADAILVRGLLRLLIDLALLILLVRPQVRARFGMR